MSSVPITSTERADSVSLSAVVQTTHEHLLITDCDGYILRASTSCAAVYGITAEAMCATTVAELERRGVLSPSVTLKVLASQRLERVMQTTPTGRRVLAEGYPVFIDGRLERVITRSHDATDLGHLQEEYALLARHLQEKYALLARHLAEPVAHSGVGLPAEAEDLSIEVHSAVMRDTVAVLKRVAKTAATVMLLGETGVGKTRLARQVHDWSRRRERPFIDVNCSAIPESLFESEMFGCLPGAFSGAPVSGRAGLMEQAQGGTLLLDEIGELPLTVQAKLLRALQDGRVTRLGDTHSRRLDFRLIAATNQNLTALVEAGRFRADLFYRLNVIPVSLPPLRARPEEIPALVEQHMQRLNERYGETRMIDESLWSELMEHNWPGNVRELENYLERQWLTGLDANSRIGEMAQSAGALSPSSMNNEAASLSLKKELSETERRCLEWAIDGARSTYQMAERLGISQPSVVRKLKKHGFTLSYRL